MGEEKFKSEEQPSVVTGEVITVANNTTGVKRLLRSRQNRLVAGVCGGIAEYFHLDPVLVRAVWAVLTMVTAVFPGVILYILAVFIVPENTVGEPDAAARPRPRMDNRALFGGILILAGLYFLWRLILPGEWLAAWNRVTDVFQALLVPAVLIGAGALLVLGISRRKNGEELGRLVRPRQGRIAAGVCSGLGHYFRVDPVWVRVIWVLLFLASWWAAVLAYVLAMLLMPEE
jgi:phage shock protein C